MFKKEVGKAVKENGIFYKFIIEIFLPSPQGKTTLQKSKTLV